MIRHANGIGEPLAEALDWSACGWESARVESAVGELSDDERMRVKAISLNFNRLGALPLCLQTFSSLTALMLDHNPGIDISSIGDLTTLKSLTLISCELVELPSSIARLTKLEALFLHNNCLAKLPSSLQMLTKLKT